MAHPKCLPCSLLTALSLLLVALYLHRNTEAFASRKPQAIHEIQGTSQAMASIVSNQGEPPPGCVRVLTYNVWFGNQEMEKRVLAQAEIIHTEDPDVICLQEVTGRSHEMYRSLLVKDGKYDESPFSIGSYGVLMLVKKTFRAEFEEHALPTQMGRTLLTARIDVAGSKMLVGTVHLESLANHPRREEQLEIAAMVMQDEPNSVLCGDFNFDSDRNYSGRGVLENLSLGKILPNHTDAWLALRPSDKGYTFDTDTNLMIKQKGKTERMRYDRIMFNTIDFDASRIHLVGTSPILAAEATGAGSTKPGEAPSTPPPSRPANIHNTEPPELGAMAAPYFLFPSDHYGVVCDFVPKSSAGSCPQREDENNN